MNEINLQRQAEQQTQRQLSIEEQKSFSTLQKTLEQTQFSRSQNIQHFHHDGIRDVKVSHAAQTQVEQMREDEQVGSAKEQQKKQKARQKFEAKVEKEAEQEREKLRRRESVALETGKKMLQNAPDADDFLPESNYGLLSKRMTVGILNNQTVDEAVRFTLYEQARILEQYAKIATEQLQVATYNIKVLLPKLEEQGMNPHLARFLHQQYNKALQEYQELDNKMQEMQTQCAANGIALAGEEDLAAFDEAIGAIVQERNISISQAEVQVSHTLLRQTRPKTLQHREEHINRLQQKGYLVKEDTTGNLESLELYRQHMNNISDRATTMIYEMQMKQWQENGSDPSTEPQKMDAIPSAVMEAWVTEFLKAIAENSNYCTRQPNKAVFDAILDGGRFLNQMEIHQSSAAYDPESRMQFTEEKFGVSRNDLQPADYERYGYVGTKSIGRMAESRLSHYGDVEFVFHKDRMKNRVTTTVGDSLCIQKTAQSSRIENPQLYSCSGAGFGEMQARLVALAYEYQQKKAADPNYVPDVQDMLAEKIGTKEHQTLGSLQYMELQYHGELTMDDVEEVKVLVGIERDMVRKKEDGTPESYRGVRVTEQDAAAMTTKLKAFNEQRKREGKPTIKLTLVREKPNYVPGEHDTLDDKYVTETPDVSA